MSLKAERRLEGDDEKHRQKHTKISKRHGVQPHGQRLKAWGLAH